MRDAPAHHPSGLSFGCAHGVNSPRTHFSSSGLAFFKGTALFDGDLGKFLDLRDKWLPLATYVGLPPVGESEDAVDRWPTVTSRHKRMETKP